MSNELEFLSRRVAEGKLSRRDFLGRAAALGVTATFANSLLASAARAEGPVKGGILKAGLVGGESTNSLDPALFMTQVPFAFGKMWGEMIVELSPDGALEYRIAEEIGSSDDAKIWTLQDPRRRRVPQRQDGDRRGRGRHARAPFRREVEIRRARLHEGHREHQGQRQGSRPHAEGAECRPALPAQRLSPDHPAERRQGRRRRRHRHRPLQGRGQRAGRAPWRRALRQLLAGRQDGPCRPGRDHRHQRRDGAHLGAAGRPGPHDQPRRAEDRRPDQARARRHHPQPCRARATTSSSCIATPRRSTTTTCAWR